MRDDAIAPIIAVMLILAAIVTFFSIWNAIYVPSMKESAEVGHLENVESAFEHFSSDIDYAVSSHQDNLVFSEPVQLGGGDVMVNLLKSSGTLQVQTDESTPSVYNLTFIDVKGIVIPVVDVPMVNISYVPLNNFWQDQGYEWEYGYINVTKYGQLSTPLEYYNMTDVQNEIDIPGSPLQTFARSFGSADYTMNQSSPGNCSCVDLWAVNLSSSPDHSFVSSNGFGTIRLTTAVNTTSYTGIADISFGTDNGLFGNRTLDSWNTSFNEMNAACPNNIVYDPDETGNDRQWNILNTISPVTVNTHTVTVEISAN